MKLRLTSTTATLHTPTRSKTGTSDAFNGTHKLPLPLSKTTGVPRETPPHNRHRPHTTTPAYRNSNTNGTHNLPPSTATGGSR